MVTLIKKELLDQYKRKTKTITFVLVSVFVIVLASMAIHYYFEQQDIRSRLYNLRMEVSRLSSQENQVRLSRNLDIDYSSFFDGVKNKQSQQDETNRHFKVVLVDFEKKLNDLKKTLTEERQGRFALEKSFKQELKELQEEPQEVAKALIWKKQKELEEWEKNEREYYTMDGYPRFSAPRELFTKSAAAVREQLKMMTDILAVYEKSERGYPKEKPRVLYGEGSREQATPTMSVDE